MFNPNRLLFIVIEIILEIFTSWTLAYHLALLFNFQARFVFIPFILFFATMVAISWRQWKNVLRYRKSNYWFWCAAITIILFSGLFTILNSRPDYDDCGYFHRAVTQLSMLDSPFVLSDSRHNTPNLPQLTILHPMTSYEPLAAMTANLLNLDPLNFYHNVSAFIAGSLLPIVYILLYRQFRISKKLTLGATIAALLFLIIDGNTSRSFGNVALVRLWQGKTILWTLFVPISLLVSHRFLTYPTKRRFFHVSMLGICAMGLSGSGLFMIPLFLFAISVAYVLGYGFSWVRLKRALLLNVGSFYCLLIGISLLIGWLPRPTDTTLLSAGDQLWWENLAWVIGDESALIRDLAILLVLPLVSLVKPLSRFPILLTISLCLLFANPLLGPIWIYKLAFVAFFRLVYLFPLPWSAGLIVSGLAQRTSGQPMHVRIIVTFLVVLSIFSAFQYSTIFPPADPLLSKVEFKMPWEYRFPEQELAFIHSVSNWLQGKNVLAPPELATILCLVEPTTRFEATRYHETVGLFRNVGQEQEGLRRFEAQQLVTSCARSEQAEAAIQRSLETGINAIIIRDCGEKLSEILSLVKNYDNDWTEVTHNHGYVLLLHETQAQIK